MKRSKGRIEIDCDCGIVHVITVKAGKIKHQKAHRKSKEADKDDLLEFLEKESATAPESSTSEVVDETLPETPVVIPPTDGVGDDVGDGEPEAELESNDNLELLI